MGDPVVVGVFVEDRGHEAFISALVRRLAREEGRAIELEVGCARGGHGRVFSELKLYQMAVLKRGAGVTMPDMLVVAIDANCKQFTAARREVQELLQAPFASLTAIACPDPHIERWYLADPLSFGEVVGVRPAVSGGKCVKDYYKRVLSDAIVQAGHPPMLNGIEFARELVDAMDLFRAGKAERSLKRFIEEARGRLTLGRGTGASA